jgi:hypothetical protein
VLLKACSQSKRDAVDSSVMTIKACPSDTLSQLQDKIGAQKCCLQQVLKLKQASSSTDHTRLLPFGQHTTGQRKHGWAHDMKWSLKIAHQPHHTKPKRR